VTNRAHGPCSRRRFLRICAASAALGTVRSMAASSEPVTSTWRGMAFGGLASIELRHSDHSRVRRVLPMVMAEIERLESIMSLYRPDSALVQLNRQGHLYAAPADLVSVLSRARTLGDLSRGRFDVSVQPLWQVYAEHFSAPRPDPAGPHPDLVRRRAESVDYRSLEVEASAVRLARPRMAVTLNGIAQGYITDRIVDLLTNEGFEHVLADLGEIRALGNAGVDRPWRAVIKNPLFGHDDGIEIELGKQALATSGSYGFRFDAAGLFHHLFDPRSGTCPQRYASVSVLAPDATTADALATACNLMPPESIESLLKAAGATRAVIVMPDGVITTIDA
jgi:FAD:protein FMN transferase